MSSYKPQWSVTATDNEKVLRMLRTYFCGFCFRNGRSFNYFSNHVLKTTTGKVMCPDLRKLICPICQATGDNAHTKKYCPDNKDISRWDTKYTFCRYCKQNGEPFYIYGKHILKDEQGNIICPILRRYVCPLCGATGDKAHTRTYCPITIKANNGIRPIAPRLLR